MKVNLRGEEFLVKRNLPRRRVGAKAWFDFFTEHLTEPNYKFSAECPRLGRNEKGIVLIHVDDLIFTGCSKYINEILLPKLEVDGLWIQPGNYTQQMLKAYEEQIGQTKLQQLTSDNSIQMEDKSEILNDRERISLFRSIVGSGIYLCQERYDVAFAVGELVSRMENPTSMSFHHLKKFPGYLKKIRKQEKAV